MPSFISSYLWLILSLLFSLEVYATGQVKNPSLPSPPPPEGDEVTVVCLGDSLTEGYGVAREAAWPALVENMLQKRGFHQVKLVNAGISGSTSASGLSRLKWLLKAPKRPHILILELGANDGLRGIAPEVTRKNLKEVIQFATSQGLQVLLAGMQMPTNYGPSYTQSFAALFSELAKEEKVNFIPFFLEGVAAQKTMNQPDGIHPNEAGYQIIAKTVLHYLEPLLIKKKQSPKP